MNPAYVSRGAELCPSQTHTGLRLLSIQRLTQATERRSNQNMSSSPTTPTSASSSSISDICLTPTSPTGPFYKPVWSTNKAPKLSIPVPNINAPTLNGPINRRLRSQQAPTLSVRQALAGKSQPTGEALSFLGTGFPACDDSGSRMEKSRASTETDYDGDTTMLSPPPERLHSAVLESVATSPILERLIGMSPASKVPLQARDGTQDGSRPVLRRRRSSSRLFAGQRPPQVVISDDRKAHLRHSVEHLGIPLVPLISVTSGREHPEFPRSILQYHLLTHDQLDSLARWYHQTVDNRCERFMYPATIERPWTFEDEEFQKEVREQEIADGVKGVDLATKRRRFGRFIGLKGCESPVVENMADSGVEELADKMDREWKAALRRAQEEEQAQEKMWRGRW